MAGGGGGAGGGLKVLADGHLGVDQDVTEPGVADATEQVLDRFDRVVEPPTVVPGDAIALSLARWRASTVFREGGDHGTHYTTGPVFALTPITSVLTIAPGSYIGTVATPWTQRPAVSGCSGLAFWFAGWEDVEGWWVLEVPEHPEGMAGITLEVSVGTKNAVDIAAGYEVVVASAAPAANWGGAPVGSIPAGATTTVTIPGGLVPAAGGELWIGVRPAWRIDYTATYCGFNWPWNIPILNSSRGASVSVGSLAWAVLSVAGDDLGTIAGDDTDEAPWDGGNEWRDAGIEGSPTWGIDGSAFWVEAEEPGGKGIMLQGEGEDEDEAWGPWGAGWSFAFDFEVDAVGDTGEAGARHIEVTTTRPGTRTIGYVHLGDMQRDPGISVAASSATDYEAVALTAGEVWTARFDDRLEREDEDGEPVRYLRGKLWRKADGEPAGWHVEVPMDATEDAGDRVVIWFRVGNGADDPQRVRFMLPRAISEETTSGAWVTEFLGRATGLTDRVELSAPHVPGTLSVDAAGITTRPIREEPGTGWLDSRPTAGMHLWATYLAE